MDNKINFLAGILRNCNNLNFLVDLINAYNCYGEQILELADFNSFADGFEPVEIANMICGGWFDPTDDYFIFDGTTAVSFKDCDKLIKELRIDFNELAQFVIDNDYFKNKSFNDVLDLLAKGV